MDSVRRYRAFISYSHLDRKLAEWVHRALETYRAPRGLVARTGGAPVGRELKPIFRDRDELAAASDLGEVIRDALDRSDAMIVLCSPASARSRWVDQELAHFLKSHDNPRIICVIAGSTPADLSLVEILPPALRAALPAGGEPLAVDLRRGADGRRLARLKMAAGLMDVSLDQLVQRDARRRLRLMGAFTAAAVIVAVGMGAMTVATLRSRQIARAERDESEGLVAYMLGDLRKQLEPVGRLDVLDGVSGKVLAHYAKARPDELDDKALAQRAKALTLLGMIRDQRGDLAGARDAFSQAAFTTRELAARAPRDGDRIFDEAQNVYWLAYVEWRQGNAVEAERGFKQYGELAQRLVALDPNNGDWRLEVAYAKSNLGTLLFEQGRPADALTAFNDALRVFEAERVRAPADEGRIVDAVDAHAWVADTLVKLGRSREAYRERAAATTLLADASAKAPDDKPLAAKSLAAQLALARLELDLGRMEEGRTRAARALSGLRTLAALDPTNAQWLKALLVAQIDAADFACWSGYLAQARAQHGEAERTLARLRTAGEGVQAWSASLDGRLAQQQIVLQRVGGDIEGGRAPAAQLLDRLRRAPASQGEEADRAVLSGFGHWVAGDNQAAVAVLSAQTGGLTPQGKDILARAYLGLGQNDRAEAIVQSLKIQGYAHPGFLAFWRNSPLAGILRSGSDSV
ncbi:toll/interleukin-1 receptor domain-containing protein [Caulobacter soli]|uniref:toll/interleukin-1 receptor domain-containing protein n=1 Tax=Caulobacter soli TaxID=2708539 RepID=UPI0013EBFFB8|nr:toll/interleukin-1 receptor domain-containing protein [Caulobacter soli]